MAGSHPGSLFIGPLLKVTSTAGLGPVVEGNVLFLAQCSLRQKCDGGEGEGGGGEPKELRLPHFVGVECVGGD